MVSHCALRVLVKGGMRRWHTLVTEASDEATIHIGLRPMLSTWLALTNDEA